MNTSMTQANGKSGGGYEQGAGRRETDKTAPVVSAAAPTAAPVTPEYKLRGNRVHARLKILCMEWIRRERPEVLEKLRARAKKMEGAR